MPFACSKKNLAVFIALVEFKSKKSFWLYTCISFEKYFGFEQGKVWINSLFELANLIVLYIWCLL